MISNGSLALVRSDVRDQALEDFAYLANHVLSSNMSDDLCRAAAEVLDDQEDTVLHCTRPRTLLVALHAWLKLHGAAVLVNVPIPAAPALQWIHEDNLISSAVVLELLVDGVSVRWV